MAKYNVFLACPISNPPNGQEDPRGRDLAEWLAGALRNLGLSVFFAVSKPEQEQKPRLPNFSLNLTLIKDSDLLVVITTENEVRHSSIWVEAGMAFALGIPSVFIAPGLNALPILVQRALAPVAEGGHQDTIGIWLEPNHISTTALNTLLSRLLPYLPRRSED